jgi:Ran GTPase-activating protein (RanGAP) involved in mRNA processing and transport
MQYSDDPGPEDGAGYDDNGFDDNWEADEAPQDQPDDGYNQYDEQYDQDGNQYDDQDGNQYDDQYYDNLIQQMQDNDPTLSRANFVDMRIGDVGAEDIAASLEHGPNTNVILLDCGQNDISEKGFEVLLPVIGASRIRHLWLRGNYMGPEGAAVLADMLAQNQTLVELSVGKNQISSTGAADIASALTENSTLTALWMYSNEIGDDGAAALSDILSQNQSLTELYLGNNAITEDGARSLAYPLLNNNTTLRSLELNRNLIGNGGGSALAHSVKSNATLTNLSLRRCGIRLLGVQALIEAAHSQGSGLLKLDLRENSLTEDELSMCQDQIDRLMHQSGGRACTIMLRRSVQRERSYKDGDLERGPLLKGSGRRGKGDDDDERHELYDDVYSMLFLAPAKSRVVFFSVFTYILKFLLFTFVAIDLFSDGYEGNQLNIPSGVSPTVRAAQFFMVLVLVAMQEDLISSLALANVRYDPAIMKSYPGATKTKWILASILRLFDGIYALGINFCILIQASDVLGMFLNFAALHFLGSVDNVSFHLALDGYLGDHVESIAKAATEATLPMIQEGIWRSFDTLGFIVLYLSCLIAWCVLTAAQVNGEFACQSFDAYLGTEQYGNISPEVLAGIYTQSGDRKDRINGRSSYIQDVARVNNKGVFAYCERDSVWGLIVVGDENDPLDPCEYQLYSGDASEVFDVTAITDWYYRSLDNGSVLPATEFSLDCTDLN